MIFLSTGGEKKSSAYITAHKLIDLGIQGIELTGGAYEKFTISKFQKLLKFATFQIHNYFPPPEDPFVFNLASTNDIIIKKSLKLAKKAIEISAAFNRPIYSFHAGFLIDPKVNELGKLINRSSINERNNGLDLFIQRVNSLAEFASIRGVELLIENNVISDFNVKKYGKDPFLMTSPEEAVIVMKNTPNNVNLLLDVAHLKVSASSLGFNKFDIFSSCDEWIKAYHFSDNDGYEDTNMPFDENAWFWPYIKKNENYYTLEVYNTDINKIKDLINLTNDLVH